MRIRTEYSCNLAYGKLKDVFQHLLDLGWEYMPISDRQSTFGFVEWAALCKKHDKKPIFGVELGVSNNHTEKRPRISYWTFFATDDIQSINELVALATSQENDCLTYKQAMNAQGVVRIADHSVELDLIDPELVCIALAPSTPYGFFNQAKKRDFLFIPSSDNTFNYVADRETYRVLFARFAYASTYPQHILSYDEWCGAIKYHDLIDSRVGLWLETNGAFTARLPQASLPKIDSPTSLRDMCLEGAAKLGVELTQKYMARLNHELKTIADKKFEDYFFIVADLMQWAKQRMIVAPGRGSSAGSLVCYLLEITLVDPLKFNLLFERFLDITRTDLPDIDMDFDDKRVKLVFDYLENKYGKERVAKIAAVQRFMPKSIINTAATSLKIPIWISKKAAEEVDAFSGFDNRAAVSFADSFKLGENSRKLLAEYPEISLVFDAEYHAKTYSIHAAGAVITDEKISKFVAVNSKNDTCFADLRTAEKMGLLKLDLLSLSQLSTFARCLELMGQEPTNAFLDQIPLDDQEAFDVINKKRYSGIFQMGRALINLFKYFHVNRFEDLVAVTSLARPGPLMSGGANRWVDARNGIRATDYAHDCLEPFLKSTYGELVYQEQLMDIARNIGGMSDVDVTELRRAVGKSKGAEALRPYGDKFKAGAERFGFVGETVNKFWDDLCGFGAYSFNRSHAVSYSIMTYYCCWLKAFYPVEFSAASLDAETDTEKQILLLRELHAEGVGYIPIDAAISTDRWEIKTETKQNAQIPELQDTKKILVGPLTSIKGIGPVKLAQIIEARASGKALPAGLAKQLAEAVTPIDSLTPVKAAIDRVIGDLSTINIFTAPTPINQIYAGQNGSVLIIGLMTMQKRKDRNDAESVTRRNGKRVTGETIALNMSFQDDSGAEILAIVSPEDFNQTAPALLARGGVGSAIYAVKGTIPRDFRMISVEGIRFVCNINDQIGPTKEDFFAAPKEDFFQSKGNE